MEPGPSAKLVVVWRVTERCNMGCRFCAYDARLARPRREADPAEVLRLAGLLRAQAPERPILVSWLGGEPLLWPHLLEVSQTLRAQGFRLGMTTNGLPAGRKGWPTWAAESLDEVTWSLDGAAPFHDWARDREGAHALSLGTLREVAQRKRESGRGPLLRVNTVLMRGNAEGLGALGEALAEAGAEELTFNQLGGNDRPEFYPANRLLPEQVERLAEALPALRERLAARGLALRGDARYLERLRCTAQGRALPVEDCGPGQRFLFIEADGRVAPCSFTVEGYGVPSAELRTPADLAKLPARLAAARAARRLAPCGDCHSTQVFEKFVTYPERSLSLSPDGDCPSPVGEGTASSTMVPSPTGEGRADRRREGPS